MAIHHTAIAWKRGPFPASDHDITIFQGCKPDEPKDTWDWTYLYFATKALQSNEFSEGARGIGDSGYAGEPKVIIVSQEGQSKELRAFLAQSKNHQETLGSRFKSRNILESSFLSWPWGREEDGVSQLCNDSNTCDDTLWLWAKSTIPGLLNNNLIFW